MLGKIIKSAGVISALMVIGCGPDPNFSEQFITLPSGAEAYCNRQGYREISIGRSGTQLVTYPSGELVVCDAKVGPRGITSELVQMGAC